MARNTGNFKARVSELREDGRTFETQSRWFRTSREAFAWLDSLNAAGDVGLWVEREQREHFIARRRDDGVWLKNDGFGHWHDADGVEVFTNDPATFSFWAERRNAAVEA